MTSAPKISSLRINTTSRRGIKKLGISFGSIFLGFSYATSRGHIHNSRWSPRPPAINDSPVLVSYMWLLLIQICFMWFKGQFHGVSVLSLPPWKWWVIYFHEQLRWKAIKGHGHEHFHFKSVLGPFYDIYFSYVTIWENYCLPNIGNVSVFYSYNKMGSTTSIN